MVTLFVIARTAYKKTLVEQCSKFLRFVTTSWRQP